MAPCDFQPRGGSPTTENAHASAPPGLDIKLKITQGYGPVRLASLRPTPEDEKRKSFLVTGADGWQGSSTGLRPHAISNPPPDCQLSKRTCFRTVGAAHRIENWTGLWPRAPCHPLPDPGAQKTHMLPRSRGRWMARECHGAKAPHGFPPCAKSPANENAHASTQSGPGNDWKIASLREVQGYSWLG